MTGTRGCACSELTCRPHCFSGAIHASWLRAVQSEFEATSRIDPLARRGGSGGIILEQAIRALTPVWLHHRE